MDDNSVYRNLFFEESDDNLQKLNDDVLELESEPENIDLINEIFRAAHTLKGMSATMGYDVMTKLTHKMENLFDFFKSGKLMVTSEYISLIFECLDKLSQLVEDLRNDKELSEDQIGELLEKLINVEKSVDGTATVEAKSTDSKDKELTIVLSNSDDADTDTVKKARAQGYNAFTVAIRIDKESMLKGPRAFLIIEHLEQEGDVIYTEPTADLLENGEFDTDFKLIYLTKGTQEQVEANINSNSEIDTFIVEEFDSSKSISDNEQAETAKPSGTAKKIPKKANTEATKKKEDNKASKHQNAARNQSIRVDLSRLDLFLNLVSELVVYRNQLDDANRRNAATEVKDSLEQVSRLTSELQDLVLKIRMQQVSVVFSRFPRMVRDLARELDKNMELIVEGEETELDKTVVSELSEPLIHLLRNSADHGIENTETRRKFGKPEKGIIKLSAYQEGNQVNITLEDDGKGLDPQVMKESAESKGIDTTGMTDDELINLIFHPGFSTAKTITNISGRGVGLDAVMAKINDLGGSLEMKTELHVGTKFVIKLPLTLSIIQALMVRVAKESFAIPLDVVERVVMIQEKEIITSMDKEVVEYQEGLIPVVRVDKVLGLKNEENAKQFAIVVKSDKQYFAVLVNELIGQQEIVIKKIDAIIQKINKFQGATIFGNGSIALILDVNAICQGKLAKN
ncbi:chemotaxis protein CheA [Liquorilactobacillus cacaonum]|uniref:Chemotaxis protein CheA n=2 Tax=Liquorilactobacillus cacaonum TaxID=483012 RepID=A0A0R2CL70_9LACO|nr:chemotaxis protein CheA [Liquorilactobacillus cacaonum]AJA33805.1 two-component system chemotaxis family sensor kinase CheA [Liquorilactobacillus cacaonum]KRM92183.1 chemotaxis protein CheA [Liquorilactobacillus cacaonum DSM 21116]